MSPVSIREFTHNDTDAVIALWQRCGLTRPWNNPLRDIERKLRDSPELFLVGEQAGAIVAAVMVGYDGHRGWISYLGVDPQLQRTGCGRAIMEEAERRLRALGCPKINLQVRTSNLGVIAFYQSLGFVMDDVVSLGKRLEHDDAR
jgi:ribosomal protein S18 acetylase RimI-like enzyme